MHIRFPDPLRPGDRVAVCAVSSGVPEVLQGRLDASLQALRDAGFQVVEGATLRRQLKGASGSAAERLADLQQFLYDPAIRAILPPWGGELAIQLLPGIDFPRLAGMAPKWLCGFSDISTLAVPLTLRAGWATLHSPNVFDLADPARVQEMQPLWHSWQYGLPPQQQAATRFWRFGDPSVTESSRVRVLGSDSAVIEGRLLGGCLDVLSRLVGTPYFDLTAFKQQPTLLYLENCELAPYELLRALSGMRLAGVLEDLAGLVLGRSSGPDTTADCDLGYQDVLLQALAGLACPVVVDADIGHVPPQWSLLNGAWARLEVAAGRAQLRQWQAAGGE
ncbi:S66 family peptidase [Vogesella oryzae]|uniref:S66 family peptidase n=1 Tax=Vogesella oryzae TaxID=1735285 RepID=UPI001581A887|nr:S66 peptidase family protein [Vogesella oryzae]